MAKVESFKDRYGMEFYKTDKGYFYKKVCTPMKDIEQFDIRVFKISTYRVSKRVYEYAKKEVELYD